jgi:hypothetical protein
VSVVASAIAKGTSRMRRGSGEQRLAASGRADEQDVALLELDVVGVATSHVLRL